MCLAQLLHVPLQDQWADRRVSAQHGAEVQSTRWRLLCVVQLLSFKICVLEGFEGGVTPICWETCWVGQAFESYTLFQLFCQPEERVATGPEMVTKIHSAAGADGVTPCRGFV